MITKKYVSTVRKFYEEEKGLQLQIERLKSSLINKRNELLYYSQRNCKKVKTY